MDPFTSPGIGLGQVPQTGMSAPLGTPTPQPTTNPQLQQLQKYLLSLPPEMQQKLYSAVTTTPDAQKPEVLKSLFSQLPGGTQQLQSYAQSIGEDPRKMAPGATSGGVQPDGGPAGGGGGSPQLGGPGGINPRPGITPQPGPTPAGTVNDLGSKPMIGPDGGPIQVAGVGGGPNPTVTGVPPQRNATWDALNQGIVQLDHGQAADLRKQMQQYQVGTGQRADVVRKYLQQAGIHYPGGNPAPINEPPTPIGAGPNPVPRSMSMSLPLLQKQMAAAQSQLAIPASGATPEQKANAMGPASFSPRQTAAGSTIGNPAAMMNVRALARKKKKQRGSILVTASTPDQGLIQSGGGMKIKGLGPGELPLQEPIPVLTEDGARGPGTFGGT